MEECEKESPHPRPRGGCGRRPQRRPRCRAIGRQNSEAHLNNRTVHPWISQPQHWSQRSTKGGDFVSKTEDLCQSERARFAIEENLNSTTPQSRGPPPLCADTPGFFRGQEWRSTTQYWGNPRGQSRFDGKKEYYRAMGKTWIACSTLSR